MVGEFPPPSHRIPPLCPSAAAAALTHSFVSSPVRSGVVARFVATDGGITRVYPKRYSQGNKRVVLGRKRRRGGLWGVIYKRGAEEM